MLAVELVRVVHHLAGPLDMRSEKDGKFFVKSNVFFFFFLSFHLISLNYSTYELVVCQQPLHARMCGFGEKDRRPIDPPPIVQLIVKQEGQETWVDLQ